MTTALPPTPSRRDKSVLAFAELLSPGHKPFHVQVRPEPGLKPLHCFRNVARKVKLSGGSLVYGWEISQIPHVHLEAQFHSVWKSPEGEFVDVTPQLIEQSPILFLMDVRRTYTGTIVRDERYALGDAKLVSRYWMLIDRRKSMMQSLEWFGLTGGHPVYKQRLVPLQAEIESIREKLKKAAQHDGQSMVKTRKP